jgi:hypothetical protein
VDFADQLAATEGIEVQAEMPDAFDKPERKLKITLKRGTTLVDSGSATVAFEEVLEMSLPVMGGAGQVRLSFWRDGLPVQAIPPQGYLQIPVPPAWNA